MTYNLSGLVGKHKKIAKNLIHGSEVEVTLKVKSQTPSVVSGAPMFSSLQTEQTYDSRGPFKCVWVDAFQVRSQDQSQEIRVLGKFQKAAVVAKFWLEDILIDVSERYGATYLDQADHLVMGGKRFQVLSYDRYGLGTSEPYMLSVILDGSYTSDA